MKVKELRKVLDDLPDDADVLLRYDDNTEYYSTSAMKCYVAKIGRKDGTAFLSIADSLEFWKTSKVVESYIHWGCKVISVNRAIVIV